LFSAAVVGVWPSDIRNKHLGKGIAQKGEKCFMNECSNVVFKAKQYKVKLLLLYDKFMNENAFFTNTIKWPGSCSVLFNLK
jgi:hypothetical protein